MLHDLDNERSGSSGVGGRSPLNRRDNSPSAIGSGGGSPNAPTGDYENPSSMETQVIF